MIILLPIEFLIEFVPFFDGLLLVQPDYLHLLSVFFHLFAPLFLPPLDPQVHLFIREVRVPHLPPDLIFLFHQLLLE